MNCDCGLRAAFNSRHRESNNNPVQNKRKQNDWEKMANDTFGNSNAIVKGVMVWTPGQSLISKTAHWLNRHVSHNQQRYTASSTHQKAAVIEVETLPEDDATNSFKVLQQKYQPDGAQDGQTAFTTSPVRSWNTHTTRHFAIMDDPENPALSIILRRDLRVPVSQPVE